MRMRRRILVAALAALLSGLATPASAQDFLKQLEGLKDRIPGFGSGGPTGGLTDAEIGNGLREALRVGTGRLVERLGRTNGFNTDPDVHIPLPDSLRKVQSTLKQFGLSGLADDLELRLNRAAEAATPKAKKLFFDAISAMSLDDVQKIWKGPEDAATQYFRGEMSSRLKAEFRPIVDRSLADVGAIRSYDRLMGQYKSLPFVPDVKADLVEHVLDEAIAGIFYYLGKEEAAIRQDPLKRTNELLRKVFGS